jgi:hypothetical protein
MERNKIYKEAQYILNHLNEIDARFSHDVTDGVYEHLQQIRFIAEEIQLKSQNYVHRPEAQGERN